ncbi:hypothetical protein SAY86_016903 [Trapa natans]|uniref:Pentatricopeptide repeat-containing protein n=1 Tax=Trapa natans TaxID=22666 RepID=A0AAN7LR92_TRANT|nr:hypothetical protein SAY86_016903 [Trapa natans]
MVKYLCKRNQLDYAMEYVDGMLKERKELGAHLLGTLVPALCEHHVKKKNRVWDVFDLLVEMKENKIPPDWQTINVTLCFFCKIGMDRFVLALCKTNRIEEGYELHRKVSEILRFSHQSGSFIHLICALVRSSRMDMAVDLLINMQKKDMDNLLARILSLLERQLSYSGPKIWFFNFFINGVGNAKNPELAREIYERMKRSGISPNVTSDVLVLKSYLKSGRISDALNFYVDIK